MDERGMGHKGEEKEGDGERSFICSFVRECFQCRRGVL